MNQWLTRLAVCMVFGGARPAPAAEPFVLKEGDRVVFLGNTLIEREQRYGYWELALTTRFPGVTFRNLGWSGDTVWGEARASFGTQADGFKHLKEHVRALNPTVIIIGYGGNEAFDGPAGLPKFEKGLNDLLEALAPTKARVVLLSPPPHEKLDKALPNPAAQNKNLAIYRDAIRETAKKRESSFIDLYEAFLLEKDLNPKDWVMTENGMHLTETGYYCSAWSIVKSMGSTGPHSSWAIVIAADGTVASEGSVKIDHVEAKGRRLRVTPAILSSRMPVPKDKFSSAELTFLSFQGLAPGKHTLFIDGKATITASAAEWDKGRYPVDKPSLDQAEKLRQLIVEKNRLYFHRWRPQNETYLFGFRKKEQGQNAIEIPQFDPLIVALEAEIAKLRVPTPHVYELKPE